LSLEVMVFIQNGDYIKAGLYIFTSLLICIISVILGIILVKKYV
jgi:fluoride ion exporter CrcB/FEX